MQRSPKLAKSPLDMGLVWAYGGLMDKASLHVRLPADLHEALKAEAERMGVSLNAQINIALRYWQAQGGSK